MSDETAGWSLGRLAMPLMLTILLLQTVLLVSAWSPAPQEVVTAREFRLVDGSGRERVTMSTTEAGAEIKILSSSGQDLGGLIATSNGLELSLADGDGNPRVTIRSTATDGVLPGLVIADPAGRRVVELTGRSGTAGLSLNARGRVAVTSTGRGQVVSLDDSNGRSRARLELNSDGATIRFVDALGGVIFSRP